MRFSKLSCFFFLRREEEVTAECPKMSSSEAIFLNTTIERAAAQSQGLSRMTDVAGVACQRFANEQRFYFLKAHLFDGAGALPLVAQSQVAWTDDIGLGEQDG